YPSSPGQVFPDIQLDGYQSKEELFYIPYRSAKLYITKIAKDMHQMKMRYMKVIKELEHVGKESQLRMAALNTFTPFDVSSETWESYIERFDCFLEANDLVDLTGSGEGLFLNFCGKQMFDTAQALSAPQPLNAVTWEALMAKLKNHSLPLPHELPEGMHFTGENKLKGKVCPDSCSPLQFKELDEVFLDGLVCGLRDLRIQRRLLAKPDLTLQSALDEACAAELSNRSTIKIKGASSSAAEKKTLAVHQEEATEEDANLPGDDDIHRLKTASGKYWQSTKQPRHNPAWGEQAVMAVKNQYSNKIKHLRSSLEAYQEMVGKEKKSWQDTRKRLEEENRKLRQEKEELMNQIREQDVNADKEKSWLLKSIMQKLHCLYTQHNLTIKELHRSRLDLENVQKMVTENRETEMNAREIKSDTITQNGQGCFVVDIEEIQDYLPEKKFLLEVKTNLEQVISSLQKRETELKDLLQTEHWCNPQITETEMMQ
ncbi:hypothetical protein E2320_017255, partial [Naja naja]